MSRYIGQYTATCDLCLRTKVLRQPPTGHLESLPTPDTRWNTISVDFVVELPESDGYDAIMVVVDSLCKRAHFLPVNMTITTVGSARQFRDNVWKLHGLPTRILSDRGPQFTAEFTTELYRLLGIKAAKTTTYRLENLVLRHLRQPCELFLLEWALTHLTVRDSLPTSLTVGHGRLTSPTVGTATLPVGVSVPTVGVSIQQA